MVNGVSRIQTVFPFGTISLVRKSKPRPIPRKYSVPVKTTDAAQDHRLCVHLECHIQLATVHASFGWRFGSPRSLPTDLFQVHPIHVCCTHRFPLGSPMTNLQFERVFKLVIDATIHSFHPKVLETCRKADDTLELHV